MRKRKNNYKNIRTKNNSLSITNINIDFINEKQMIEKNKSREFNLEVYDKKVNEDIEQYIENENEKKSLKEFKKLLENFEEKNNEGSRRTYGYCDNYCDKLIEISNKQIDKYKTTEEYEKELEAYLKEKKKEIEDRNRKIEYEKRKQQEHEKYMTKIMKEIEENKKRREEINLNNLISYKNKRYALNEYDKGGNWYLIGEPNNKY